MQEHFSPLQLAVEFILGLLTFEVHFCTKLGLKLR